jgi:2-iminobutanoate/2-iminopropanoate deaminase
LWIVVAGVLAAACGTPAPEQTAAPAPEFKVARKFLYPEQFAPGRPYTPGVLVGDTLYVAGQVSLDPKSREQPASVEDQTRLAMDNIGHVLRAAGMDYGNLVTCHVQLDDMENYKAMNEVYGSYYQDGHYPARTTLQMPGLPGGSHLEITCTAYADKSRIEVVRPPEGSTAPAMGPYSPAVWAGDTLYVSGQGGRDPKTNQVSEVIEEQAKQTLDTIGVLLKAAGLEHKNAVFVNLYYLGPENYAKINTVYKDYFEFGNAPARASFCLARLPGTISTEITFIAARDLRKTGRVVPQTMKPSPTASPGTIHGDTLYLAAKSSPGSGDELEAQFRGAMAELLKSLQVAGMGFENAVSANVYLKDLADMDRMNELFREYFPNDPPVRTTVQVREEGPREKVKVEVALIAVR